MKILVTGANGFVGVHVCQHLLQVGHQVTALVRNPNAAPPGTLEVIGGDIGADTDWTGLLAGHDVVVHLAARVHVMDEQAEDPFSEFRAVNTAGTIKLALAAAAQDVSRFVFLSSIKVNGEGETSGLYTAGDTPSPQDPYGISKYEAETALFDLSALEGLEVVVVRPPLVYGPGVGGNFVKMLKLCSSGLPVPLGSVKNRRTMVSVWNLADLVGHAATEGAAAGAIVLAGDSFSPSTPEMLRAISAALGTKSRVFRFPTRLLRFAGKVLNKSNAIDRLLGSLEVEAGSTSNDWVWNPPLSFDEGIRRTAAWYHERNKEEKAA